MKKATWDVFKYNHIPNDLRKFLKNLFGNESDDSPLPVIPNMSAYKVRNIFEGVNDPFLDEVLLILEHTGLVKVWLGLLIEKAFWPDYIVQSFDLWANMFSSINHYPLIVPIYYILNSKLITLPFDQAAQKFSEIFSISTKIIIETLNEMKHKNFAATPNGVLTIGKEKLPPPSSAVYSNFNKIEYDKFWINQFIKYLFSVID